MGSIRFAFPMSKECHKNVNENSPAFGEQM